MSRVSQFTVVRSHDASPSVVLHVNVLFPANDCAAVLTIHLDEMLASGIVTFHEKLEATVVIVVVKTDVDAAYVIDTPVIAELAHVGMYTSNHSDHVCGHSSILTGITSIGFPSAQNLIFLPPTGIMSLWYLAGMICEI